MTDLVDTTEMYLKSVWELLEDGIAPLRARLADRLGHSAPTVSQTVARMERDGLVRLGEDRAIELTSLGTTYAMRVMRKHRLAKILLNSVLGLEPELLHDEACRWEHVMSPAVERRIAAIVPEHCFDPFGNPVPGLADLGVTPCHRGVARGIPLPSLPPGPAVLLRIGEPVQVEIETVRTLWGAGLVPGASFLLLEVGQPLRVRIADGEVELPEELARHLFVEPPPSPQVSGEGMPEGHRSQS